MFDKIFNIGNSPKPVQAEESKPVKRKAPVKSVKADALKTIEKLLDELQGVNNAKVDSLRKLYHSLDSGNDMKSVAAFYREPIKLKKKKKAVAKY